MNPHHHHHSSNQNPATASALQQVNSINNQQMCDGNVQGLYPNSVPIVAPSCFMNFPNHPFPLQNTSGQFPNCIGGFNPQQNFNCFPQNQFYPPQHQGQFFANNSMVPTVYNQNVGLPNQQALVQSTIQNIHQLLQLQNPSQVHFPPGNSPMFPNQIANAMSNQSSGFPVNQQFGMPNHNGHVQHANQGQPRLVSPMMDANASKQLPPGNTFLPHSNGPVPTQQMQNLFATMTNYQNQIAQGVGLQNSMFLTNQLSAMANPNVPVQHVNQGSSIIPLGSSSVQTHNPRPTLTSSEDNHGNMPANVNGGWAESQHKNFTGHKRSDTSHKGFKSPLRHAKHVKEKLGVHDRNMNKGGNSNAAKNFDSQNSTKFKKLPSQNYTEQEIKQWREARKKNFPSTANVEKRHKKEEILSDVTNQEAMLRRQQLKEILAKQAELGCEVAEIPPSYLSDGEKHSARSNKREWGKFHNKRGKFHNKRGPRFQDHRTAKKTRQTHQDSPKFSHYEPKPKEPEPSLLKKLLARDIKRDKSHLLQVFRFLAVNSFLSGKTDESLRFPSVVVRENGSEEVMKEEIGGCMNEGGGDRGEESIEEEEGEIVDGDSWRKEVVCVR